MKTHQLLLLKMIKATIEKTNIENLPISLEDLNLLFIEAKAHDIVAFLFPQIEKLYQKSVVPQELYKKWKQIAVLTGVKMERLLQEFSDILLSIKKSNINVIALKGLVIRELYPQPEFRTMGDADILVRSEDLEKITSLLCSYGYKYTQNHSIHINFTHQYRLPIEVHWSLINENYVKSTEYLEANAWKNAIEKKVIGVPILTLKNEDHLVYLLLHMAVHLIYSGFGLRQIIDFALFSKAVFQVVNWNNIKDITENSSMSNLAKSIYYICNKYFSIDIPEVFSIQTKKEKFFSECLLEDIFEAGTFGFSTKPRQLSNSLIRYKKHTRYKKPLLDISYFVKLLFPLLKELPDTYSYALKRPILLPIAWLHRIIRIVFRKDLSLHDKLELTTNYKKRAKLIDWLNIK